MGPRHDPAGKLAAVVIERHVKKLRTDLRRLSRRALGAGSEQGAELAEARCPERRPAEQPCPEDAERDRYRKLALDPGEPGTAGHPPPPPILIARASTTGFAARNICSSE